MKLNSEHFLNLLCYTWNKCIFFWFLFYTTVCEFNSFSILVQLMQFKRNLSNYTKWASKLTWEKNINMGKKKLWRHISFSSTYFWYYRKHRNIDNTTPSSACFQQYLTDSLYLVQFRSGKIWMNSNFNYLQLFNFN